MSLTEILELVPHPQDPDQLSSVKLGYQHGSESDADQDPTQHYERLVQFNTWLQQGWFTAGYMGAYWDEHPTSDWNPVDMDFNEP